MTNLINCNKTVHEYDTNTRIVRLAQETPLKDQLLPFGFCIDRKTYADDKRQAGD